MLCTIGAGIGTAAMFLSEPTFVNWLAGIGSALATAGGVAWIAAASFEVWQEL
jgi:hypothetical protein